MVVAESFVAFQVEKIGNLKRNGLIDPPSVIILQQISENLLKVLVQKVHFLTNCIQLLSKFCTVVRKVPRLTHTNAI